MPGSVTLHRLLAACLVVLVLVFIGAFYRSGSPESGPPESPVVKAATDRPRETHFASEVAKNIVTAPDLAGAVAATEVALAQGGLAVRDFESVVPFKPAVEPAAAGFVHPVEVVRMAQDGRARSVSGRLTLAELGQLLSEAGWPFKQDSSPGEQLRALLASWVALAQKNPSSPHSFTPLFLAEMAKYQMPSIDIAAGEYGPDELRLTFLELQLFVAAFFRYPPQAATGEAGLARTAGWFGSIAEAAGVTDLQGPCSQLKDWIGTQLHDVGKVAAEVAGLGIQEAWGEFMNAAMKEAGMDATSSAVVSKVFAAVGILTRLIKLGMIYTYGEITVAADGGSLYHKSAIDEPPQTVSFTARAGVRDEAWEEYKQAMKEYADLHAMHVYLKDCAGLTLPSLPVLPDVGDLAKDVANWRVEWEVVSGAPEHVEISLDKNEFVTHLDFAMPLKMSEAGDASGTATLVLDLDSEPSKQHSGELQSAEVTVRAALDTAGVPGADTLLNAVKGGAGDPLSLADALVQVGSGWVQEMAKPQAYATVTVRYHTGGLLGHITYTETRIDQSENHIPEEGTTHSTRRDFKLTGKLNITSSKPNGEGNLQIFGRATTEVEDRTVLKTIEEDGACRYSGISHERALGFGAAEVEGWVTFDPSTGDFGSLFVRLPGAKGWNHRQFEGKAVGCGDPPYYEALQDSTEWSWEGREIQVYSDPSNPYRWTGTWTSQKSPGWTIRVEWDLELK